MQSFITDSLTLENDRIRLRVALNFGPRIMYLAYKDGPNLLADLPDAVNQRPDGEFYHFYGGHRLWLAPEDPIRTYALDNLAVDISRSGSSLLVRKPIEKESGVEKSMRIVLAEDEARVTILHSLANLGNSTLECAPWALTQFIMGGTAILPQSRTPTELLPNRSLVLWPYTDLTSPHVSWGNRFILVHARQQQPFKIGFPNPRGWLAYWLDGTLFVKWAPFDARAQYGDLGCSSECYCNHRFIELETLAPLLVLAPGASITHTETWELYRDVAFPENEDAVQAIADEIGLE
jgi:hypothetical protein